MILRKDPILKVVFYEVEIEGETYREAAIFKESGVITTTKEKGYKAVMKLAKEKGFTSIENDLKKSNCFEVHNKSSFMRNYPKLYQGIMESAGIIDETEEEIDETKNIEQDNSEENELDENNNTEQDNIEENDVNKFKYFISRLSDIKEGIKSSVEKIKKINGIKKLALKTGIITLALASSGALTANLIKRAKEGRILDTTHEHNVDLTTEETTQADSVNNYSDMNSLLTSSSINSTRATALTNIWSYLSNYNGTIATNHISKEDDAKLAHTWNEVISYYLAYNKLPQDEINEIFGGFDIDVEKMEKAYKKGIKQDMMAYAILTESTKKADLITSEVGKQFYTKYENMLIEFNNANSIKKKKKIADEFNVETSKDFKLGNLNLENIESYKLSVVPIIRTFDKLNENLDTKFHLNWKETKFFEELSSFSQVKNKIQKNSNQLFSYNIAQSSLEEDVVGISYGAIKDFAINELKSTDSYNISKDSRDITSYPEYKDKFKVTEKKSKSKTTTQTANSTTTTSTNTNSNAANSNEVVATEVKKETQTKSNSSSQINYNVNSVGIIEDNEKSDKIPKWMQDDEEKTKTKTKISIKSEIESNITEFETATLTSDSDLSEEVIEVEPDTPNTTDIENVPDEYDDVPETDETEEDLVDDTTETIVEDANTPLPDPNSEDEKTSVESYYESVADSIVEAMANDAGQEDISDVLVK